MPYTANATLTEYFRVMELPDKSQWIRFTQIVEDPEYLTQPWVVNYAFKKLPDASAWRERKTRRFQPAVSFLRSRAPTLLHRGFAGFRPRG